MKEVLLAKSAGFCYGVRRAVEQAQQLAQTQKIYLLGEITHNAHVIAKVEELGAVTVHSLEEVPQGATVLIRAHGEPDQVYAQLQEKDCQVVDATCPNVTRIHDIVRNAAAQGRVPVIVGDPDHPEIVGIAGCAENSVVAANWEKLEKIFQNRPELVHQPLTFVSQTTAIRANWENSVENAKKVCTNAEYFDTICGATSKRQTEAAQLAGRCDSMIVIGDPKSSNTRRLTQICQESCAHVVQVEQADALSPEDFCSVRTLGITAGASTPEWIIKEVYNKMSDEIMEIEQSFAEMLEESFKTLNTGDKVTGTVVAITPTEVQVELGIKYPGYIPVSELSDDPDVKVEDIAKVGEEIETYVMLVSDRDCMVKLSKKRLDAAKNWETIENAVESKEVLEGIFLNTPFTFSFEQNVVMVKMKPTNEDEKKALSVKGFVYDEKKQPLPGVTVQVVGTSVGTATNAKGWFAITLPILKGKLKFSFVGYKDQEVEFSEKTDTLKIYLKAIQILS